MATEKIKFKLQLFATYWDKKPMCNIMMNDKKYWSGEISGTENKPELIEFEHELDEGQEYNLTIERHGKDRRQTVINKKGNILHDQMLHIKSIEIDEIDIGSLVYEGVYTPKYQEPWATQQKEAGIELPKTFKNVSQMGHNGTWAFKFSSPFYMWLLENLY